MSSETIKITRRLIKNANKRYNNHISIQGKIELIIGIIGKPHNKVEAGVFVWNWKDKEVKLFWKGFGFFELESDEHGIKWFLDFLVERAKIYNDKIKYGIYECKNNVEWDLIKVLIGDDRLSPYLDCIKIVDMSNKKKVYNYWQFN